MPDKIFETAFAVGRVRSLENRILTSERIQRLLDAASAEDAFRLLADASYGQSGEQVQDYEELIDLELRRTVELIDQITPDADLTNLFFMHYDVHNIKTLYKGTFTTDDVEEILSPLGKLDHATLKGAISSKDYRLLPDIFAQALAQADKEMPSEPDPGKIDAMLDQAYFQAIGAFQQQQRSKNPFVTDYFALSADFNNVLLALRLKAMGQPFAQLESLFLPGGTLTTDRLAVVFEGELTPVAFSASPYYDVLKRAWERLVAGGMRLSLLEKERDNALFRLAGQVDQGPTSMGPVLRYMLAREQEAKIVRLIMTGKVNRLPDSMLRERVRELYA